MHSRNVVPGLQKVEIIVEIDAIGPNEWFYSNVVGQIKTPSLEGSIYFVTMLMNSADIHWYDLCTAKVRREMQQCV